MHDHNDPNRPENFERPVPTRTDIQRADADQRDGQSDGMGAIVAVVAVAALVIIGMLYVMQPPNPNPARQTSEAPPASAPTLPLPTKPAPPPQ
jgi:hypothetical protein